MKRLEQRTGIWSGTRAGMIDEHYLGPPRVAEDAVS